MCVCSSSSDFVLKCISVSDCTLLVQQLAESEIKVEELEKTLSRVRSERDDARVTSPCVDWDFEGGCCPFH